MEMSDDFRGILGKYEAKVGHRLTEADGLMASAYQQGFHLAEVKGVQVGFEGGSRHFVQKVHGIMTGQPLWKNLQGQMSPALRGFADDMGNMFDKWWKSYKPDSAGFKQFQKDMAAIGQVVPGEYVKNYFPISPRYSRLEGAALYGHLKNPLDYGRAILDTTANFVSGAFKKRTGLTIGKCEQLRKMEKLGMTTWVDDLVRAIDKDVVGIAEDSVVNKVDSRRQGDKDTGYQDKG